jgi:penicillin-binding protein 1C
VLDREGRLLRLAPEPNGRRLLKLPEGPLPPLVAAAFVAAEDQRFFRHGGVDAQAVGRALMANLAAGRIVSGASTITQQLARLTRPAPRTYYHKTLEMLRAVRLELALEKTEILRYYLNRAPLSHNLMGVETGALGYFGKPAARLGASQAAMLAALVKAPSALNPYGPRRERLLGRRNWVLARMAHLGFLSPEECSQAQAEPLGVQTATGRPGPVFPFEAPHLVEMVLSGLNRQAMPADGVIRTSIDLSLQRQAEAVVRSQQARLKPGRASQAAAVIVDNRGGEILALVGSFAYEKHSLGFNNGATARRSPGSALKPFLYALALDEGLTPAMLLEDIERRYRIPRGEFIPANFDRFPHGPVSFREALGNSLNLSAVHLLELVGPASYYDTLYRLGLINRPERGPGHYGLGLVVGNPEVSLLQLAAAYAALANGGRYQPLRWRAGEERPPPEPLFSPQAAYIVTDILADPLARARSFGGSQAMNPSPRPALKTGTSTRYRDCWAVAYTPAYTVGVWVGNFDGPQPNSAAPRRRRRWPQNWPPCSSPWDLRRPSGGRREWRRRRYAPSRGSPPARTAATTAKNSLSTAPNPGKGAACTPRSIPGTVCPPFMPAGCTSVSGAAGPVATGWRGLTRT